ncbi:MAG: L-threonylcarbamoyladenylate synthase [Candidatus Thorarchaeota archaeon]
MSRQARHSETTTSSEDYSLNGNTPKKPNTTNICRYAVVQAVELMGETVAVRSSEDVEDAAKRAVEVLRSGGLVVYPTDTSYGISCDPSNEDAILRLLEAKQRPASMGLPLLYSDLAMCDQYLDLNEFERVIAKMFWPGPLTLVVTARTRLPYSVTGKHDKVAARIPDHSVPRAISRMLGGPIVGTSANRTGGPSPFDIETARAQLGNLVELYLDSGPSSAKKNSTIVEVEPGDPASIRVHREGEVSIEQLRERLRLDKDALRYWSTRITA